MIIKNLAIKPISSTLQIYIIVIYLSYKNYKKKNQERVKNKMRAALQRRTAAGGGGDATAR